MNREIKFKAWLRGINKMTHPGTLEDIIKWAAFGCEPIWLQYTGLKDKNLTEIYEGDIVEYDFSQQSILVDTEVIGVGEVVFVRNYAAFAIKGNDDESFESLNSSTPEQANEFKVIGNIYEENSIANIDNQ